MGSCCLSIVFATDILPIARIARARDALSTGSLPLEISSGIKGAHAFDVGHKEVDRRPSVDQFKVLGRFLDGEDEKFGRDQEQVAAHARSQVPPAVSLGEKGEWETVLLADFAELEAIDVVDVPDAKCAQEEDGADAKGALDLVACLASRCRGEQGRARIVE